MGRPLYPGCLGADDAGRRAVAVDSVDLPGNAVLHLGSGALPIRIRPLEAHVVRLTFATEILLQPGDRGVLRNPGLGRLEGGVEVLDVAPPQLRIRGAAARRGEELAGTQGLPDVAQQVQRRGAIRFRELARLGVNADGPAPVRREGEWLVSQERLASMAVPAGRRCCSRATASIRCNPG